MKEWIKENKTFIIILLVFLSILIFCILFYFLSQEPLNVILNNHKNEYIINGMTNGDWEKLLPKEKYLESYQWYITSRFFGLVLPLILSIPMLYLFGRLCFPLIYKISIFLSKNN